MAQPLAELSSQRARTKIVATVGPACDDEEALRKLIAAGVDVLRLNTAHGTLEQHQELLGRIARLRKITRPLAVLIDLAGPKIRLGTLAEEPTFIARGTEYRFIRGATSTCVTDLVSNYEHLIDDLKEGDDIMLADGTVSMVVTRREADAAICLVLNSGMVRSRQGINLPGALLSLPALTERDIECALWAAKNKVDYVSLSFVRAPDEIHELRRLLRENGADAPIIAKIEKPQALDRLDEIVTAADGVMVARGDLGVEIDVAEVPGAQKRIIATCHRLQRPVIVATQMLDSMQNAPRPTRAEASDVANAIWDGADACMLSGETAVGQYPVESVGTMNRIMLATEKLLRSRKPRPPVAEEVSSVHPITSSIVYGAGRIAELVKARLVVIATRSGATALAKSSQRAFIPSVAISEDDQTLNRMSLLWGITPLRGAPCDDPTAVRDFIIAWGRSDGSLETGDRIVVVTGTHVGTAVHNTVVVHEVP